VPDTRKLEAEIARWDELLAAGESGEYELARALIQKGLALFDLERWDEVVACSDEVLKRFGGSLDPDVRAEVVAALFNKAVAFERTGPPEDIPSGCSEGCSCSAG
jgi:hypothetical protein